MICRGSDRRVVRPVVGQIMHREAGAAAHNRLPDFTRGIVGSRDQLDV